MEKEAKRDKQSRLPEEPHVRGFIVVSEFVNIIVYVSMIYINKTG